MPRCRTSLLAGLVLAATTFPFVTPASGALEHAGVTLAGTWQVKRTCMTGCTGSKLSVEVVRSHGGNIFLATGGAAMALYLLDKQVLVHSSAASTLLTIETPGRLMSGPGIAADGSTFISTWRCIAPPAAHTTGATGLAPHVRPGTRVMTC